MSARELITGHLDLWTGAVTQKSTRGRGSNGKVELTGVKKLRELILELAVRGKLVGQNNTDEPARDLLDRIAEEKSGLISAGRLKKQTALPPISDSDTPYPLPSHWTWTRLGNYGADIHYGFTASANEHLFEYRLLRITDIQNDKVNWTTVPGCEISKQQAEPYLLSDNDILIARTGGTIGKSFLVQDINVNAVFASYLIRLKKLETTYARYVKVFLGSHTYWSQLYEASMGTGQPNVNGKSLKNLLFPVPPIKEQHRIVQKVDELMALCDRLEQQTSDQLEAHETLVDTLLGTLTQSENATELADNWARLAAHFDTLFTTEQSIDKLKQTILQLAVMGRLVEQDAGDEPIGALLQSIEDRKAKLIKSGTIKRSKPLPPVSREDHPFRLPDGWGCHRLGGLVSKLGSGSTPRGGQRAYIDEGVPFLRSQNVWNDELRLEDIVYISEDTHARMNNTVVYPQDILLNITGASLGRSTIFPDQIPEANVSQHVTIVRLIEPAMTSFVQLCIQSPLIQSLVWGRQVGMAIEGLSKKVLERFEMPIPPLQEQRRIVQKVDELMTLCEELKERLNRASETRNQLAEAVVDKALN